LRGDTGPADIDAEHREAVGARARGSQARRQQ
jgi:hypothetical protein